MYTLRFPSDAANVNILLDSSTIVTQPIYFITVFSAISCLTRGLLLRIDRFGYGTVHFQLK